MTIQATTQSIGTAGRKRRAVLASLALGAALAASVALAGGTARQAEGAVSEKIVFASNRTTGKGVVNPTGDREIFVMNPNGTGAKQLTFNAEHDVEPILSPDGTRIAFMSKGDQTSNPEGDSEVYVMNVQDGSDKKNLSDNAAEYDESPEWGR